MQPAAKKQRQGCEAGGGGGETKAQQLQGNRKGKKAPTPSMLARTAIHQAAKANDLATALEVFDRAQADGVRLTPDLYVSLLYLCSGGDAWGQQAAQAGAPATQPGAAVPSGSGAAAAATAEPQQREQQRVEEAGGQQQRQDGGAEADEAGEVAEPPRPVAAAERRARAQALFGEMAASGGRLPLTEMCYTALARLEAGGGDPDRAFQLAQASAGRSTLQPEMAAAGLSPKLRSYTPALIAFAEAGRVDDAFAVDASIAGQGLDLGEPEFARLLQAAAAGASWQRAVTVLRRIGAELTALQPDTLARVRTLFASPAAAAACEGGACWAVGGTAISEEGVCGACGGQLQALDLSGEELTAFASGIAAIAERQERRPNDFQQFKAWLAAHGPHHAVIDGANVALYGQNFESGGFNFGQIRAVLGHLAASHPDLKPLLLLNARAAAAQALMTELGDAHSFYVTPAGSNDDWYWIYAAVTAGERGLLVSNDEMRDHIFQLLAPKYFLKWKQRHQLKYRFTADGLQLDYPAPYTTCTQELACGSWVFPGADGSWLCARRVEAGGEAAETAA